MSRPWAQSGDTAGRDARATNFNTRVRSRALPPPWRRAAHRERVPTREVSEDASVSEGLCCSFLVCFCTVIRGAFCIVPVQASGIFGQVPLSPAPVIPSCVYHAARAGAPIHLQLRAHLSSALELSRSQLLTHPLATQSLYLSLIFTSSLSLPFSSHAHA